MREFVSRKINEADKLSDMFGHAENYIEGMERFSQLFFFFLKNKTKLMKNEVIINRKNKNEKK